MNDVDFVGAEQLLTDGKRSQSVGRDSATGIADHMAVADTEPESLLRVQACVHTGDDSSPVVEEKYKKGGGVNWLQQMKIVEALYESTLPILKVGVRVFNSVVLCGKARPMHIDTILLVIN